MSVKQNKRNKKITLDTIWPDGIRTRNYIVNLATAKRLDLRVRAAKIDGSWRGLRQSLGLDRTAKIGTVNDLIERYLVEYCEPNNRRVDSKRQRCRLISRILGSTPAQNLSPAHVTTFIARRRKEGAKPITINRDLEVVFHMSKWAAGQGIIPENKISGCKKMRTEKWEGRKPDQAAVDAVFAQLPAQVVPFFTFLRETGCRSGEALNLRHGDVDHERCTALFRVTKAGKPRRAMLTKEAMDAIRSIPPSPATDHVFYNPITLKRWYSCRTTWARARTRAGIPWLRVHDLRKYFGIRLAESGCPMHFIQAALGHSSVTVTESYYAQFSPDYAGRVVLEHLEKMASGM